jgi:DNA-binding MarR family transcriptional regulator
MSVEGKSVFGTGPTSELAPPVRAFRTLLLAAQRLRYLMDARLRPDGLTTQQAALLTAVLALGAPSVTEIAAALGTSHQNAAQLVTALRRKGMLRVDADPTDGRRTRLAATAHSDAYWHDRDEADHDALASWFGALSGPDLDTLCNLLDRLVAALPNSTC